MRRIREFLDRNSVHYVTIGQSPAGAARPAAKSANSLARSVAGTTIVNLNGFLAMAVVPATKELDLEALRQFTFAAHARLADESEIAGRFEGCQPGTVPPFGALFGVRASIDRDMARREQIAFRAGTLTDVILMQMQDYLRLARPAQARLAADEIGTSGQRVE